MTRKEQIKDAAIYYEPGNMRDSFIEGAEWADETILKEVIEWLDDGTIDHSDEYADPIVAFTIFDNKEQMLQSFKDRFNIE